MSRLKIQGKSISDLQMENARVKETVSRLIQEIRSRGDSAVRSYSEKFDNWSPANFRLSRTQLDEILKAVPPQVGFR